MINFAYMHFSPNDFGAFQTQFAQNSVPQYQFMSMKQTRFLYKDSRIVLLCNPTVLAQEQMNLCKEYKISIIDYRLNEQTLLKYLTVVQHSHGKLGYDPFYKVTLLRYIYTELLMDKFNLDNVFFIEGDNIIYIDNETMNNELSKYTNSIVTCGRTGPGYYSSGVFYCNNLDLIKKFNNKTIELIQSGLDIDDMSVIHYLKNDSDLNLKEFPCLPSQNSELIFDPSSYGQYLGGDNHQRQKGYIHPNHLVGKFIQDNVANMKFGKENDKYFYDFEGKRYFFANLHIHNKNAVGEFITHG